MLTRLELTGFVSRARRKEFTPVASNNIIAEFADRVRKFKEEIPATLEVIVADNEQTIVRWNAENQLFEKGENRLGIRIDSYQPYTPLTIQIKKDKGQPYDRVTLRDEGDFERSFYIEFFSDGFRIYAFDSKVDELTDKYGSEILGLNEENFEKLIDIIRPLILERAKIDILHETT